MNYRSQKNLISKRLNSQGKIKDIFAETKFETSNPHIIFARYRLTDLSKKKLPTIIKHQKIKSQLINANPYFDYKTKIKPKKRLSALLGQSNENSSNQTIHVTKTIYSKNIPSNLTTLSISPLNKKTILHKRVYSTINNEEDNKKMLKKNIINKFELNRQFLKQKFKLGELKIRKALKNVKNSEKELSKEYMKIKVSLNKQFEKIKESNKNINNMSDFTYIIE